MKMLRGLICLPIIFIFFLRYKCTRSDAGFWDNGIKYFRQTKNQCLGKWLLIGAISEKNAYQILEIYASLENIKVSRLTKRSAIALFESAIWMKDRDTADSLLKVLTDLEPKLGEHDIKRNNLLYLWRFASDIKNLAALRGLLSPLSHHEIVLPYVEYFAGATIADNLEKTDDALRLYRESLKSMPNYYHEYKYALERCNDLLKSSKEVGD